MSHTIFRILDDFSLKKPQDREKRVHSLSLADYEAMSSRLDNWYLAQHKSDDKDLQDIPRLDMWLPFSDTNISRGVSRHLLISDKVFFNDVLSDVLSRLIALKRGENINIPYQDMMAHALEQYDSQLAVFIKKYISDHPETEANELDFTEKIFCKLIDQYFEMKEAIDEGFAIPRWQNQDFSLEQLQTIHNVYVDIVFREFVPKFGKSLLLGKQGEILFSEFSILLNSYLFSALELTSLSDVPSPSFSLDGDLQELLFASTAKLAKAINPDVRLDLISTARTNPTVVALKTLDGLPIADVLDAREKEKSAFQVFKYSFCELTNNIQSIPGTASYENEIATLRNKLLKEIHALDIAYENIKRDASKGLLWNASMISLSVILAAASLSQPQININFITQVASGAGLIKGVSDILDLWQTWSNKKDELRTKDFYFLWKASKLPK